MAYADKCTTMRRCVLLNEKCNGNIGWEGVNIEGVLVLKSVTTGAVLTATENQIKDSFVWDGWFIVYQDAEDEPFWVPRDKCYRKHNGDLTLKRWKRVYFPSIYTNAFDKHKWWYLTTETKQDRAVFNYLKSNRKSIFRKSLANL